MTKELENRAGFLFSNLFRCRAYVFLSIIFVAILQSQTSIAAVPEEKGATSAQNPCAAAKELHQAGLFDQAIAKYEALLKDEKTAATDASKCARSGLLAAIQQQMRKNCGEAAKKLDAGLLPEAEALYKKLAAPTASADDVACARNGLRDVAKRYIAAGEAREKVGNLSAAEAAYEAAKNACVDCAEPHAKLQNVRHEKNAMHLAKLLELGLEEEAKKKYRDLLESDATFGQKVDALAYIDRPRVPLWTELRKAQVASSLSFLSSLPEDIWKMPLTEAIILALFLGLIGQKYWWGAPAVNVGDFTAGDDKSLGPDFAAELEHQLMDINSASRNWRKTQMVSGQIAPLNIDLSTVLTIPTGWLGKALQFLPHLFARRTLVVKGLLLEREKGQQEGVVIQIQSGNHMLAKHTLWKAEYGTEAGMNDLALCAAVWVLFMLRANPVQLWAKLGAFLRRKTSKQLKILGTVDWEAYAWFALGDKWYQSDQVERAEAAYLRALNIDPKLLAGRVNLAGIYHRYADREKKGIPNEARHWLECALRQLDLVEGAVKERRVDPVDPSPYTGLFRRAAVSFDLVAITHDSADANKALEVANDLVTRMREARSGFRNPNLVRYLDWRLPVAECMALGLKVAASPPAKKIDDEDKKNLERITQVLADRVDFYSQYNLACTYALFAAREECNIKNPFFEHSMRLLERSLEITARIESLGAGSADKLSKRVERVKNDAAFESFWQAPEFLRIVAKTFTVAPVPKPQQAVGPKVFEPPQAS